MVDDDQHQHDLILMLLVVGASNSVWQHIKVSAAACIYLFSYVQQSLQNASLSNFLLSFVFLLQTKTLLIKSVAARNNSNRTNVR